MWNEASLQAYRAQLRGTLLKRGDPEFDQARKVYNAMIDKRPRLIARCADVADVIASVNFARENNLLLAVRGGGHNGGGLGVCDDGIVDRPGRACAASASIPRRTPCASTADAAGAMWTTRPTPSAWRRRRASSRPPAWAGSLWAAASGTCRGASG